MHTPAPHRSSKAVVLLVFSYTLFVGLMTGCSSAPRIANLQDPVCRASFEHAVNDLTHFLPSLPPPNQPPAYVVELTDQFIASHEQPSLIRTRTVVLRVRAKSGALVLTREQIRNPWSQEGPFVTDRNDAPTVEYGMPASLNYREPPPPSKQETRELPGCTARS